MECEVLTEDMEFQSNVTRFTLPIHSLAFSATGGLLAAAGEDNGIKLISTIDNSIVRVLKGHSASVISLAFDPKNDYLASAGSDGTVMLWEISSGKRHHTLYHAAPNADLKEFSRNKIAWHPNGDVVAVPGRKDDIVMYDRDTGEKVFSLKSGHTGSIGFLAWSPNGKYLATSAEDRQVMLWDVENRQDLDCQKFDSEVCSLAWRSTGNALGIMDMAGRIGVWEPAVPSHMMLPTDGSISVIPTDQEESFGLSDDDSSGREPEESHTSESGKDKTSVLHAFPGRTASKQTHTDTKKVKSIKEANTIDNNYTLTMANTAIMMQASFQPGSTEPKSGKRFLCYNLLGCVSSCENNGSSHIEVEFHDTGRSARVPSMADYFGFTMAALSENGCVFGAPMKGEKSPSTIMYRPFSSWANNSEWSMRFPPGEEVQAVALGSSWVAASTSLNLLRIFSEGGLQRFLLSLEGPVVTMVGQEQLLAIVVHSASPFPSGQQVLKFVVFNVLERTCILTGPLPLSPEACLAWLGFSESGVLSSYDSKGMLRLYNSQHNGCWIPVFSASKDVKSGSEKLWVVGLNDTQLFCVICKPPDEHPHVLPKPVLSVLDLSLPLAYSDLGADDMENQYLRGSILLSQIRKKADEVADQQEEEEDKLLKMEADLDRCLLRLIAAACKGDKLVRALELAKMLSLNKSLKGAIKLATAMRLPALAERLNNILEENMIQEDFEVAVKTTDFEPATSFLPMVGAVLKTEFSQQQTPERISIQRNATQPSETARVISPRNDVPQHSSIKSTSDIKHATEHEPISRNDAGTGEECANDNHTEEKGTPLICGTKENVLQRPKNNPFAKSADVSTNKSRESGVSILQSLKRIHQSETECKKKENVHQRPAKLARTVT